MCTLTSAFVIQKKLGGNRAFFGDKKASIFNKTPHISLYFTVVITVVVTVVVTIVA